MSQTPMTKKWRDGKDYFRKKSATKISLVKGGGWGGQGSKFHLLHMEISYRFYGIKIKFRSTHGNGDFWKKWENIGLLHYL